jgi:G3E family GTPase
MIKKIPVVILNGFLGSGKTTLFRDLLSQSKKKNIPICALVNDMSELDVDGILLGSTDIVEKNKNILESIHSCVLSSKKGIHKLDLGLKKLLSNQKPELIIIETSGSCHPMPLTQYFKNHSQLILTKILVLLDSLMLAQDFNYGEDVIPQMQNNLAQNKRDTVNLMVEQIMFGSHLILTKADRIAENKLKDIASSIKPINPFASIHSVHYGKLEIESLLDNKTYDYVRINKLVDELKYTLEYEDQADRPYNLSTRVIKDDRPFHPQRLWDICHQYLDQRIYRSKGFFWLASRDKFSLLWNQAAGGINLEIIGSWRSGIIEDENHGLSEIEIKILEEQIDKEDRIFGDRHCDITVIGDQTQVDRFTNALKSCFLNDQEIELWKNDYKFDDPWPKNITRLVN